MSEKHHHDSPGNLKLGVSFMTFAFYGFSTLGETFLHVGMGWLYPIPAIRLIAIALPYGWSILWAQKIKAEGYSDSLLPLLSVPSLLFYAMLAQWCLSVLVRRRTYSHYTGFPLLNLPLFFLGEAFVKQWVEPALLLGVGWYFYPLNRPLMSLVFAVGLSMFLTGRIRSLKAMFREQGYTDSLYRGW